MFFVPNRINTSEGRKAELEQREATIKILGGLGTVTPRIKQSVVIKRYSTIFPLDSYQYNALNYAFEAIINGLNN
jgi:chromosome partitioning protein